MEMAMGLPDLISHIALRLPLSEPHHLVRASQISKTWLRELTGPVFRKAYTQRYPNPQLLGYFSSSNPKFVPLCPLSPCLSPARDTATWNILDCRNGRVLVHCADPQLSAEEPYRLLVWNPVTGDHELLPLPPRDYQFFAGAILCDSRNCDHVQCASFLVVFVGCDTDEDDEDQNVVWESCYFSTTGQWSSLVKLQRPQGDYRRMNYKVEMVPPLLIKGALYFTFDCDEENEEDFLKYQLEERKLSLIKQLPVDYYGGGASVAITSPEGGFGVVTTEDNGLTLWSWRENTNDNEPT